MQQTHGTEVGLWQRHLVADTEEVATYWGFLSQPERNKANRFYHLRDVKRYIIGRGWMRQVLAAILGEDPAWLTFTENSFGKPQLTGAGDLHFNLTHSHGYAVLVTAIGFEVGVDIEFLRSSPDGVAEHFFSENECATLAGLPAADRDEGFFACWTRKEAFVKALGAGLSFPLADFSVSLAPGKPAAVEHIRGDASEVERWQMETIRPTPDFIGAVAARRRGWQLKPGIIGRLGAGHQRIPPPRS